MRAARHSRTHLKPQKSREKHFDFTSRCYSRTLRRYSECNAQTKTAHFALIEVLVKLDELERYVMLMAAKSRTAIREKN